MAELAIKGHATRGKEVIELLEMMGGKQFESYLGNDISWCYTIINGEIDWDYPSDKYKVFTLEEFLEKYPYKIGDRVSSKYLKNYKIEKAEWESCNNRVIYKLQGMGWYSVEELQPYKEETMEEKLEQITVDIPNEYEFFGIDDNNKIVLTKKQLQYPKTYVECAKILDCFSAVYIDGYKNDLLEKLQELLVCRDAIGKLLVNIWD
jgi:hypothetical protein